MNTIEQLRAKKEAAALGGGQSRIDAQHGRGKLTARERLNLLFDENTFVEIGGFRKHRCNNFGMENSRPVGDGVVTGYGYINSRLVYAYAQDFTVQGGSLGEVHAAKIVKIQEDALKNGAPIVGMLDSGGARIQENICSLTGVGKMFRTHTLASGVIPQISAIMGPCAGAAVYGPALTDYIFMVDQTSNMFITGPDVIRSVTGEIVTTEELGGARVHNSTSGVAHFMAPDDAACITQIRALLSYLPNNNSQTAPVVASSMSANELLPALDTIIPDSPTKGYNMYDIINSIADPGSFFEVQPNFAGNVITGYARFNGETVGIIANQPKVLAGCLDINSSDKAARFIRCCDAFNTPLLSLVDVPGYLPGPRQEHGGIIRHGAKLLYAYSEATVPKFTIVTRKAYGGGYNGMCCYTLGADITYAWPSANIAVMGASGAANIIFRREINEAEDPTTKRAEKIKEYEDAFSGPYFAAEYGYIDDVIEPNETRVRVINALQANRAKRETLPPKKHGNIPL